jgi:hypothetical protein
MSDSLNKAMEFDHVIQVGPDGTVSDGPEGVYAPESVIETDDDGQIMPADETEWQESLSRQGWEVLSGYSSQDRYPGPIMHASESIGGALAGHIRETPGLWVAVTMETIDDSEDAAGWAVCHRDLPAA